MRGLSGLRGLCGLRGLSGLWGLHGAHCRHHVTVSCQNLPTKFLYTLDCLQSYTLPSLGR